MSSVVRAGRRRPIARRALAVALAVTVLALSAPASSWAYWRASTTAPPVSLSAGTVEAPATIDCRNSGSLLDASATVFWDEANSLEQYEVTISSAGGAQSTRIVDQPSIVINAGLLGGLAGLLSSGTLQVSVKTIRSGWISSESSPQQPVAYTLLPLGARCA